MTKSLAISKAHPTVKAILSKCFPSYKGRKVRITEAASVTRYVEGGGTSVDDRLIELNGGAVQVAPAPEAFRGPGMVCLDLTVSTHALVTHSMFCGKDAGITITLPEASQDQRDCVAVATDCAFQGDWKSARELVAHAFPASWEAALRMVAVETQVSKANQAIASMSR